MTSKCGLHCWLRRPEKHESNVCFSPMNFTCGESRVASHMKLVRRDWTEDGNTPKKSRLNYFFFSPKLSSLPPAQCLFTFPPTGTPVWSTRTHSQKVTNVQLNEKSLSRSNAKGTGGAAFVSNKSHLTAVRQPWPVWALRIPTGLRPDRVQPQLRGQEQAMTLNLWPTIVFASLFVTLTSKFVEMCCSSQRIFCNIWNVFSFQSTCDTSWGSASSGPGTFLRALDRSTTPLASHI